MKVKPRKFFGRHRHSLFVKLLVLFIITGVVVEILVFAGMRHTIVDAPGKNIGKKNLDKYIAYLADDIGIPPDEEKMRILESQIGLDIRVEDKNGTPLFGEHLPSSKQLKNYASKHHNMKGNIGRYSGQFFLIRSVGDFHYLFFTPKGMTFEISGGALTLVLVALTLVIAITYFLTRRLLEPIKQLNSGMTRFGNGELDLRVKTKGKDELAGLTDSFNAMADQINDALETKEQLLFDVSHELRSPLTRMKVALEFLENDKNKEDIGADILEMEHIITLILESARLEKRPDALNTESGDLVALIEAVVLLFEESKPGLVVKELPNHMIANLSLDLTRLVLRNVIENALKYSGESTRPIELSAEQEKDRTVVQIQDFGLGMERDELEKVFEPFYRVDKSRQKETGGIGLGLHFCKKAMRAQKGDIYIESEPNKGTRVFLVFDS